MLESALKRIEAVQEEERIAKLTTPTICSSNPLKDLIFECSALTYHIEKRTIEKKTSVLKERMPKEAIVEHSSPDAYDSSCRIM